MLNLFCLVDFIGGFGKDPIEEVEDTVRFLIESKLPLNLVAWSTSFHVIDDYPNVDIVTLDYGGVLPGCEDMVKSQIRSVWEWAENHPTRLVIVYSTFTWTVYSQEMKDQFGELKNVMFRFSDYDPISDVLKFFSIDPISDEEESSLLDKLSIPEMSM